MGFFTRKEKVKRPGPRMQPASLVEPPNVYVPSNAVYNQRPPIPPRPTTAITRSNDRCPPGQHLTALRPDHRHQCGPPVIVNQHYYYMNGQPAPPRALVPYSNPPKANQPKSNTPSGLPAWCGYSANLVSSTVSACDEIASRLNHVLTMIDGEHLKGHETDLFSYHHHPAAMSEEKSSGEKRSRDRRSGNHNRNKDRSHSRSQAADVATSVIRGNYFSKVDMYANSRLPRDLAPFAV